MAESYNGSAIPLEHPNRVLVLLQNVPCLHDHNGFPATPASIVVIDLKYLHDCATTCSSDLRADGLFPFLDSTSWNTICMSDATVGLPAAMYSSTASGKVSTTQEDNAPTSYAATILGISRRCPRKRTFSKRSKLWANSE